VPPPLAYGSAFNLPSHIKAHKRYVIAYRLRLQQRHPLSKSAQIRHAGGESVCVRRKFAS
jgi:hypothetical protein